MSVKTTTLNKHDALLFLQAHQPMPPDSELDQETIDQYDQVRRYFIEHPDVDAIALLLNSFGEGDGFGVYQLVEDAIIVHTPEAVIPHLQQALKAAQPSVQYWCAQIASHYSDKQLLEPLAELISDENADIREAAMIALAGIDSPMVKPLLQQRLADETDVDVQQLLQDIFVDMEGD